MGLSDEHKARYSAASHSRLPSKNRSHNAPTPATSPSGTFKRPIDLTAVDGDGSDPPRKSRKCSGSKAANVEEKRLRSFRTKPPKSYLERLHRAQTQRMFVISRNRQGPEESPEEVVELAGSTGNIYKITICKMPSCTCPDSVKGNQCKHVIYVLSNVLKTTGHLRYQLAYLSSELREIFRQAPIYPPKVFGRGRQSNRKPLDGDCPICFTEFDPDAEEVLYCKASCGNNVHKECFQQWARTRIGKELCCIYCRAPWKCDQETLEMIQKLLEKRKEMATNEEGYLNVAQQLGISQSRDYSTYHQPWVVSRGRNVRYGVF